MSGGRRRRNLFRAWLVFEAAALAVAVGIGVTGSGFSVETMVILGLLFGVAVWIYLRRRVRD